MAGGSTFGTLFCVSTWGESHGKGVGVVIDGCPAGLPLSEEDIQIYLDRRKPGQSKYTTKRKEGDQVEILSGVFEGQTTGTPISMVVYNQDQKSRDYSQIMHLYRPGHADYTFDQKYGLRDYRGGGRSSGRETIARVAAGAVAAKILKELGVEVYAYTRSIGPVSVDTAKIDWAIRDENPLYMPDREAAEKAGSYLETMMEKKDSAGGVVECIIRGLPAGIGETVFDKLDAQLAKAMLSVGAVKGFEVGDGFAVSTACGSENNDAFYMDQDRVRKKTNHAGGILGGMSDGDDVVVRAAFKPTPSISQCQETVTCGKEDTVVSIKGRHDPVIVPRAVVVVESMAAITVLDLMLSNLSARMDYLKKIYNESL